MSFVASPPCCPPPFSVPYQGVLRLMQCPVLIRVLHNVFKAAANETSKFWSVRLLHEVSWVILWSIVLSVWSIVLSVWSIVLSVWSIVLSVWSIVLSVWSIVLVSDLLFYLVSSFKCTDVSWRTKEGTDFL